MAENSCKCYFCGKHCTYHLNLAEAQLFVLEIRGYTLLNRSIKYKIIKLYIYIYIYIYQDFNIFFALHNHLPWLGYLKSTSRKISIKLWYGLVRGSLNFVGAVLKSIKLFSTQTCSLARVKTHNCVCTTRITGTTFQQDDPSRKNISAKSAKQKVCRFEITCQN